MSVRLWLHPAIISEYVYNAGVRVRRTVRGHRRQQGTVPEIIRACIERCWNGRSFTASPGHFKMFWTRDMCFSAPSLHRLSDHDRARLRSSLEWALGVWTRRNSHITTTIHFFDRPADVYDYGVDSLPLFMAALRTAGAEDLVERHRDWLEGEVAHYYERVVDPATGLVRSDRKYSAHRDTVVNRSNAYGNAMVALLAKTLGDTGWFASPFERHFEGDYGRLLIEHFWREDRFSDALGEEGTSGEANVWPFWTGVVTDHDMLRAALATLAREGFTDPYPLRYETKRRPHIEVWLTRHLLPDYQGSTVWTSIGAIYLSLLRSVDPAAAAAGIGEYEDWIRRDGTFWEVMNAAGRCWVSPRYVLIGEESMLWSAIFLDLIAHPTLAPALLSPTRR